MTVREMIGWLERQDGDAEVLVISHSSGQDYYDQGGTIEVVPFSENLSEYTDVFKDQRTLLLGAYGQ